MPTAVQEGTTIHRTLTHDAYDETWTDELEGRPVHNGTPLEVHVRGRWVPVVYLRDSHTSREGPRAFLRYQKGKKTVPLAENMALRWPPPAPPVPELPHYLWWGDVPEGLLTKTALKSKGLKPGGPPVATIRYGRRNHYQETVLYDRAQAMPRAGATPAQLAALQKAQEVRKENEQRRRDEEAAEVEREEAEWEAWLAEQAEEGRIALREIVARGNWLSLDTETTGIDEGAEVVEVALVSPTGKVLFESLVRPVGPVREEARAVHGITDEELAAAPSWPEVYAQLVPLILGRELVAWNASFDRRVLRRSSTLHGLTFPELPWHCAMDAGAAIWGEYSEYHDSFRWVGLDVACLLEGVRLDVRHHRAAGDGQRLSALMNAVAAVPAA
ncbi:3'-5' exonuclease [Deinococcus aestuarii]|uniref:3'-5' exonuclease n=1 Tax=Deinococcus aestuarii TaxID=2774531 RepID=UPI001FE283FA|nr:3'-5' exonuclease [Deinococcus aestuarii]